MAVEQQEGDTMANKIISSFDILHNPLLNKGTAFTKNERDRYNLHGILPGKIEKIEDQLVRVRDAIDMKDTNLEKHIYLRALQDENEVLFYRFVVENINEMLPIIYTPVVGEACEDFHHIYRHPRGLFLSYNNREYLEKILAEISSEREIKVIVVTDGERILGLGDQGAGGLGIPIGKLSLYSAIGGVNPKYTLPIILDVGTNNPERLEDIQYLGWRHKRITGDNYYDFVDQFVQAVKKYFPNVLLQFEDFAQNHAYPLLNKYKDQLCTFNDDIQGTASVVVAAVLSAVQMAKQKLSDQKIIVLGAGSAGCGISQQLVRAMLARGMSRDEALRHFYLVDRVGLLHNKIHDIQEFQHDFVKNHADLEAWGKKDNYSLFDVVHNVKPTILIGVSGQPNQFTEEIITKMAGYCKNPIILPLSNPTSRSEATPENLIKWSNGNALIATGSPFPEVNFNGTVYKISQSNNVYIFPGMGLAVLAGKITRITDTMMLAAAEELGRLSGVVNSNKTCLLPEISQIRKVSEKISIAIIKQAIKEGYSRLKEDEIARVIEKTVWFPEYTKEV